MWPWHRLGGKKEVVLHSKSDTKVQQSFLPLASNNTEMGGLNMLHSSVMNWSNTLSSLTYKTQRWPTLGSTTFVTLSFVYACLNPSLHTSQVVSTCPILCLLDRLGLHIVDFVNGCVWCPPLLARRLSAWMWDVCISPACCFWGCWKFVQRFGVARLCYLSLCVLLWFGIVCLCFCLDYYGMQLAAEPLPVYCPHPGPGIITDITRLFTVWEPR